MIKFNIKIILAAIRTYIRNIKGRKFEPEIKFLKHLVSKGQNCLHIGASDARHSFVLSGLIGNGQIYAFEPSSYSYSHLVMMTKLHRLKNIHTYNLAISDKERVVQLITPEKSTGHAGRSFAFIAGLDDSSINRTDIKSGSTTTEEVRSVSVDDFVEENRVGHVDFIRCDTEGSEMLIINGAKRTIEKDKPNLLIEIHSDALKSVFNSSSREATNYLFELGYMMFREDNSNIHQSNKVDESEKWKDYFFIHPDRVDALPEGPFRDLLVG